MDEKPKSIWNKSSATNGWFRAWLILWRATFIIIFTIAGFTNNLPGFSWLWLPCLVVTLIYSALIATVFIGFWKFGRWICCWRNFKRFLFGLACCFTLVALFYAEEDWRGKHDWEKFKREWEAKGEHFDFASVIPPPVPDDQNFAFSPVWIAEEKFLFQNTPARAKAWYGDRIYSDEVAKIFPLLPVSTSTVVGTNMWSFPSPPGNSGDWTSSRFSD